MKRTGTSNPVLQELIQQLKIAGAQANIWARVAEDLEKPSRQRRTVNISRISLYTKPNDMIIIPGKVLGAGTIKHNVTVAALSFSNGARESIEQAKGKAVTIEQLLKQQPKPRELKLIG